jgi:hypothetical protein
MNLDLSERQRNTIAAAMTILAACVILAAIGFFFWLLAYFVATFSSVFMPLAVAAIAALVFKPYFDLLQRRANGGTSETRASNALRLGTISAWLLDAPRGLSETSKSRAAEFDASAKRPNDDAVAAATTSPRSIACSGVTPYPSARAPISRRNCLPSKRMTSAAR